MKKKYKEETWKALKGTLKLKQRKNKNKKYTYPDYALTLSIFCLNVTISASVSLNFLRKYFLMLRLKQFTYAGGVKLYIR